MLAGLFDEEGPEFESGGNASEEPHTCSVPRPPCPRNATGLCGLGNLGATCYLSALLQTLHFTPELRGVCVCVWVGVGVGGCGCGCCVCVGGWVCQSVCLSVCVCLCICVYMHAFIAYQECSQGGLGGFGRTPLPPDCGNELSAVR